MRRPRAHRRRCARRLPIVALLAAGLAAGGCGADGDGSRTGPPRQGDPLPPFTAATLSGDTVSLRDLEGPLLVNLWATWCAPCRAETPYLQSIHEAYHDQGLKVIGITVDDRGARASVDRFLEEFGVTYGILHDPSMGSMDVFGAIGLPATYLVDREGTIAWARLGPVMEGDPVFEEAVRRVVEPAS